MALLALTSTGTPWFPADDSASPDPCVITTGSRSNNSISLFPPWARAAPRDADHYEMSPPAAALPFDATELQDDSFVNFSVGNLDRRNFSVLGVAKYVRPSPGLRYGAAASHDRNTERSSAEDSEDSPERGGWMRRRGRKGRRVLCFRP